jgi:hypothetical protein
MQTVEYLIPYTPEWWDKMTLHNIMQATITNMHVSLSSSNVNKMVCMICGDDGAKDYIVLNNQHPELLARMCDDCQQIQKEMHDLETILYASEIRTVRYGETDIDRLNIATHYQMRNRQTEKITSREFCPTCGGTFKINTEHFWGTFGNAHLQNGCIQ